MNEPNPLLVISDLNRTPRGIASTRYAGWLAKSLGTTLIVRVPDDEDRVAMRQLVLQDGAMRYGDENNLRIEHRGTEPLAMALRSSAAILVTPASNMEATQKHGLEGTVHLLFSYEEDGSRQAHCHDPICLPFGDRVSSFKAAGLAIPLAKKLEVDIRACHTTSRNPRESQSDALLHLASGAREMKTGIEARAMAAKVAIDFTIALEADDIVDFVIQTAVDNGAGMIAMGRASTVLHNSNADLVVRRSHLPVLVAA